MKKIPTTYILLAGQYERRLINVYSTFASAQRTMNQLIIEDNTEIMSVFTAINQYNIPTGYLYLLPHTAYWIINIHSAP